MAKYIHVLLCPKCTSRVAIADTSAVNGVRKYDLDGRVRSNGTTLLVTCHQCDLTWGAALMREVPDDDHESQVPS